MFDLGKLIDGVSEGKFGIPEFQRDFDWSEADTRSLLASVFAGWPAGSLLFLEGSNETFQLREFEKGPALSDPLYAVLDGQQRLTSLYHAICDRGETKFAIKWDADPSTDLDELIVAVPPSRWTKELGDFEAQASNRLIPISAMRSASTFFEWRDELLGTIRSSDERAKAKTDITNFYTYRLSAFHNYEFPVVTLEGSTEPDAIARIFEKVNRTGIKLGAFDLMVAKTFDKGWNLRDKWAEALRDFPRLSSFLNDDGMAILQAIALIEKRDLRQSTVLSLNKATVHRLWDSVVARAAEIVEFLVKRCGVLEINRMPYANLIAPFIAYRELRGPDTDFSVLERWFWYTGFASAYDAAANTRMVSHFRAVLEGDSSGFFLSERRNIDLAAVTRRSDRALWNSAFCAVASSLVEREDFMDYVLAEEADESSLFSLGEILDRRDVDYERAAIEFRSALNLLIVPRRISAAIRKSSSIDSLELLRSSELYKFVDRQLPSNPSDGWLLFRSQRARYFTDFMRSRGVANVSIEAPLEADRAFIEYSF